MRIGIINRYMETVVQYEKILADIEADIFFISTELNRDHLEKHFRDVTIIESLDNYNALKEIIMNKNREKHIDILVASHEFDIEPVARIREELGIGGQLTESAKAYRDKVCMCELLKDVVRVPKFAEVRTGEDIIEFSDRVGFPFVVKPKDGAGSVGFVKLDNEVEMRTFIDEKFTGPMIAQEYITGEMCHVDGLFDGEKMLVAQPSEYINGCLAYRENKYVASMNLEKANPLYDRLKEETLKVLRTLPCPDCVFAFHAEFFVTEAEELVFCEIASRVGGGGINKTFERKTGIDLLAESIRSQCFAKRPEYHLNISERLFGFMLIPPGNGVLKSVAEDCPYDYVVDYRINNGILGEAFSGGETCVSEIARIYVCGDTEKEMREHFEELNDWANEKFRWGRRRALSVFM